MYVYPVNGFADAIDPTIKGLQDALVALAQATGNQAINPGSSSGVLDDATMRAVAQSFSLITGQLPTIERLGFQAALVFGATTAFAKQATMRYANVLTAALNATAQRYASQHPSSSGMPTMPFEDTPWYKTPLGIVAILGGGFLTYKLIFSK